jgi:uncharacterized membrane protein
VFFQLSSWALALVLFTVILAATGLGLLVGRHLRDRSDIVREPFAALQAALLGVVGLILAFGLALALDAMSLAAQPSSTRQTPSARTT